MSTPTKKIAIQQLDLFAADPTVCAPGSAEIATTLRAAISTVIKHCSLSRWQIAGKMSELLDKEITKAQLDSWTAESKEQHRFPLQYLPAFCLATEDITVVELIARHVGCQVVKRGDFVRLELGRVTAEELRLRERRRELQAALKAAS